MNYQVGVDFWFQLIIANRRNLQTLSFLPYSCSSLWSALILAVCSGGTCPLRWWWRAWLFRPVSPLQYESS